ncbi:hypothetical protein [Maridesulfovibrio sp. FT414]|uniref:hypothetical protein n=1 Tax=Maridesulfovibrio sp. FT414 TaxID=2979469 RepID=UPI003D8087EF
MKVRKVVDLPGGAAITEVVAARPAAEFDLDKVSEESQAALRNAVTVEEFKRAFLVVQWGRDAADKILGPEG